MVINNTREKVLTLFLEDPTKEYNIREVSKRTKVNYRLAYKEIMNLKREEIITIHRMGTMNICKIDLSANIPLYTYIEGLRRDTLQEKHAKVKVIQHELKNIPTVYFTALFFGSFAKGTLRKNSDIDILFIIPDKVNVESFEKNIHIHLHLLPYHLDINVIKEESFIEMGKNQGLNIRNEVVKNHIILTGAESYYKLLRK